MNIAIVTALAYARTSINAGHTRGSSHCRCYRDTSDAEFLIGRRLVLGFLEDLKHDDGGVEKHLSVLMLI